MNPTLKAKAVPNALEPAWPASVYVVAGPDPPSPAAANAKRTFTPGMGSVWPRSSLDSRSVCERGADPVGSEVGLLRSLGCVCHVYSRSARLRPLRLAVHDGLTGDAPVCTNPPVNDVDVGSAQEHVIAVSAFDLIVS